VVTVQNEAEDDDGGGGIPGFELIFLDVALSMVMALTKRKKSHRL